MPMTTNDIRVIALLSGLDPKFLIQPDATLLAMVYHECAHRYVQGEFKAFYDSLPSDIATRFMVDQRTLDWMLANKRHFLVATNEPTLADRLEWGVDADIWYDLTERDLIYDIQTAMLEAAKLLRKHGLDK